MRERPLTQLSSLEERRKLKPENKDIILFNGKRYVVTAVGSKYIRAYEVGSDRPDLTETLPVQYITKTGEKSA